MTEQSDIYQLRLTIAEISPLIWRRLAQFGGIRTRTINDFAA